MSSDTFDFEEFMDGYIADLSRALNSLSRESVGLLYTEMLQVMDGGGKVHLIGNGGSAATPFSNSGARVIDGSTNTGGVNEGAGGGPHDHPFSGTVNITGTYTAQVNLAVQYVDVIMCKLD